MEHSGYKDRRSGEIIDKNEECCDMQSWWKSKDYDDNSINIFFQMFSQMCAAMINTDFNMQ
jgi:hypothetical protein